MSIYKKLDGRFALIDRPSKDIIIIGCLGPLHAENINQDEKNYIAAFYTGFPIHVTVLSSEVLNSYPCKNANNYNNFLKLTIQQELQ